MVVSHLKQTGKVKKLGKWVPRGLTANQKNHFEVSSSLILHNNNKPFLDQTVTCNGKWILYNSLRQSAQWLAREAAPKHFPKPNLHQKKGHSHCLVVCCPSDPLQLSECSKTSTSEKYAQQIYEMHRKLQCLQLAGTGQQKGPSLLHNA